MISIYKRIQKVQFSNKVNNIFYTVGMLIFSFSSILLMLIITRLLGKYEAGIFSIGWAICQQMLTIGLFGTRNVQVSDIENRYNFSDFFSFKFYSIPLMIIGCLIYSKMIQLDEYATKISVLLTFLMTTEVLADVCAGFHQKMGKIGFVGISYIIRVSLYDILFVITLVFKHSLEKSIFLATVCSYLWLLFFDIPLVKDNANLLTFNLKSIKKVFVSSFAICISAFLTNYIVNIPKNSISLHSDATIQTYYNIISMPSFIISLFASVILVPMYTNIAYLARYDIKNFMRKFIKIQIFLMLATISILILGEFIGIPLINLVYGINISRYKIEFGMLIFAGGFSSLSTFLVYILTIFSKSNILYFIYGVVSVFSTFISNYLVKNFELLGAAAVYLLSTFLISLFLMFAIFIFIKKEQLEGKY